MPSQTDNFRWGYVAVATLLALVAVVRAVSSYGHTAQAFDEPTHVGAAIELLDKGTYTLDPVHPPLARIAIGLPLYLAGERYPSLPLADSSSPTAVGNVILNGSGDYRRNLMLARLGVLPFLLLGCAVVFLWARREYGDSAGVMAVAMFTTLPTVLAFSSIAYTDMVAASTQAAALWAFATWLDRPSKRSTVWMGVAAGLALMAKATTCIYLPACILSLVVLRRAVTGFKKTPPRMDDKHTGKQVAMAGAIAIVVVWAGYGFAAGHVRESMQLSAESMPSFQHFPAPLARIGRELILSDPRVPAPALMRGLATAWVLNKTHPDAYLLGQIRPGGWWYFFLVGVVVKSPLPFLILVLAGLFSFRQLVREARWKGLAPAACALAVLLVTVPVKYNAVCATCWWCFPCWPLWRAAAALIFGVFRGMQRSGSVGGGGPLSLYCCFGNLLRRRARAATISHTSTSWPPMIPVRFLWQVATLIAARIYSAYRESFRQGTSPMPASRSGAART